jgi:3-hydroxyanthranilate 3,4-dioxygenase
MLPNPINLQGWIDEHRHLLKPPVGNKCIVDADYIVMIVGGPNARTDYHYEDGPEWFYQLEGEMVLRIQEDGSARDIPIRAGEMFYLPPHVPHSPQRMPGSIGLVIERKRLAHEDDALMWFCIACNHTLYEEFFHLVDIETGFLPGVRAVLSRRRAAHLQGMRHAQSATHALRDGCAVAGGHHVTRRIAC